MKKNKHGCCHWILLGIFLFIPFSQWSCATGPGTAEGNMGSVGLFMQLKDLSDDETLATADDFQVTLEEFLIFFSGGSLVNRFFNQDFPGPFMAELFEGEAVEILELEEVPGVDYQGLNLILGLGAPGEHDHAMVSAAGEAEVSVFIHGQAQNQSDGCHFTLELIAPDQVIEVNREEQVVRVVKDSEAVIPILFNQRDFFAGVTLGSDCTGDDEIEIAPSDELVSLFTQSFELGEIPEGGEEEAAGHTHSHE